MFLLEKEKKAKSPHAGVTQPHTDERELAPPSSRLRSTRRVFVCFIRHVRDDTEFATEAHKLSYGTSYPVHVMSATRVHTEISGCSLDHRRVAGEGKHFELNHNPLHQLTWGSQKLARARTSSDKLGQARTSSDKLAKARKGKVFCLCRCLLFCLFHSSLFVISEV